ncbi:class I SAM-dependent methyltransferase [Pseudoduganella albidiflava]|uniref:Methyltransferase domain-containing protein n=1 Tax=Pseudoduganella albidiflava TaxID=321983 RepID=A0A411WXN6_9BURK|nr:class I SAM-dependent methyltransferase [Pseudoduganella albidiflava]QBI01455.1 methyltransferase domain-containing protein [Pseudoduganella albidiflava]GGY35567.1 hypothetical protein GCM10007387_17080 [Pseudoduganella albidiflava]
MQKKNGYVVDSVYPSYFYPDTQPLWLSTIARLRGIRGPDLERPWRYCELGCGTGFNAIVAAALNPHAEVVGIDFNPHHIDIARAMARDMGVANVAFQCRDFQQFAHENKAGFDIIDCHGVWSWVSPGVQRSILEIVARHLRPKGLFCLHYMCHPGSTPMIPVHHLLRGLARPGPGGSRAAVAEGLRAIDQLLSAGLFDDQPRLRDRLSTLKNADADHLAHDLLGDFWSVHNAGDIHWLAAQAGVSFIGSSEVFYNTDSAICIPDDMRPLLRQDAPPALVETLKDMASGRPHRSDVFQKNASAPTAGERLAALESMDFIARGDAPDGDLSTIGTPLGPMAITDGTFRAMADLARRGGTLSFGELAAAAGPAGAIDKTVQAIAMLLHAGILVPAQKDHLKAGPAAIANINALLAARNVALRLDRDGANACFLPRTEVSGVPARPVKNT